MSSNPIPRLCERVRAAIRPLSFTTALVVLSLSYQSCSTLPKATENGLARPPSGKTLSLPDRSNEDVNGNLPARILIKTRTQSFNSYHYYALRDGKIWYKALDGKPGPVDWKLFGMTGLPENKDKKDFIATDRIVEISADADELVVLSRDGVFYRISFDKVYSRKDNYWFDAHGWPDLTKMTLDARTLANIAWSVGKRNSHVLYYEDAFGHEHHYGTMGISSTYVLLADGQEIVYEDTGLPTDFSHNILAPEKGAFRSVALSVSASTIFLIGEAGEMYTRLADFDTIGSDPMFFKYTYEPYTSDLKGTDYRSNFTPWALPSEAWRKQPRLPIAGKARASRHITILQNGHGNAARELRVAGLDSKGNPGYWSKGIFDGAWKFVQASLSIPEESLLDSRAVARGTAKRGTGVEKTFRGKLWDGGIPLDEWIFEIPDFSILEGSCTLIATRSGESARVILHPVEVWTFLKRDRPGRDGTPKPYFVTVEVPPDATAGASGEFREAFDELFTKYHQKLFHFSMEATTDYILIEKKRHAQRGIHFLLTSGANTSLRPFAYGLAGAGKLEEFREYSSPKLSFGDKRSFSNADKPTMTAMIEENVRLRWELTDRIEASNKLKNSMGRSRVAYSAFHAIAHATQLFRIDFPKIYTLTRFGNDLFASNTTTVNNVTKSRIFFDEKLLELVDLRLAAYRFVAGRLARGKENVNLPSNYADDLRGYWEMVRLPAKAQGTSSGKSRKKDSFAASLSSEPVESGFPGWILKMGDGSCTFLIEAKEAAKTISSHNRRPSPSHPVRFKGLLYLIAVEPTRDARRIYDVFVDPFVIDDGMPCDISWDGKKLLIEKRSLFGRVVYFSGTVSRPLQ